MNEEAQFAFDYFKALRAEIELRIRSHHYITISKVVACAALFGHLVGNNSAVSSLISVPVLAFGLDLVMYHNIRRVNDIGKYIRSELEGKVFKHILSTSVVLFEHMAQTKRQGVLDMVDRFGHLVITTLFAGLAFFLASPAPPPDSFWLVPMLIALLVVDAALACGSRASDR